MKLEIDLVPSSCWFHNVRSILSQKQWDIVRKQVYNEAYSLCQICGGVGPKHPVECHEVWEYNDKTSVQKLVGLIALCPDCHIVKHFGLAQLQGKQQRALKHLMKVNGWKKKETEKYLADAFMQWVERSSKTWKLNISYLKKYGIETHKLKI